MLRCSCSSDYESCQIHDWRKVVETPSSIEEKRAREIRREMRAASNRKQKQEF